VPFYRYMYVVQEERTVTFASHTLAILYTYNYLTNTVQ